MMSAVLLSSVAVQDISTVNADSSARSLVASDSTTKFSDTDQASDQNVTVANSNEQWKEFSKECKLLSQQNLPEDQLSAKMQDLLNKYDGAEADIQLNDAGATNEVGLRSITKPASVHEKIVKGGVNDFAGSTSALAKLRTYYGLIQDELVTGGAVVGVISAGLFGAIFGAGAGGILSVRSGSAQSDVKTMINNGKSNGGCRITLTDEFPIASLTSTSQSKL